MSTVRKLLGLRTADNGVLRHPLLECIIGFVTPGVATGEVLRGECDTLRALWQPRGANSAEVLVQAVNKNPTRSQIHTFGLVVLGGMLVIGVLLWYRGLLTPDRWWPDAGWGWNGSTSHMIAVALWGLGVLMAIVCGVSYSLGRVLYIGWMTSAMYLGVVMTTLLLSVLFLVVLPVFSLIRFKDPLRLKLTRSGSYWENPTPHEATIDRMQRPF